LKKFALKTENFLYIFLNFVPPDFFRKGKENFSVLVLFEAKLRKLSLDSLAGFARFFRPQIFVFALQKRRLQIIYHSNVEIFSR